MSTQHSYDIQYSTSKYDPKLFDKLSKQIQLEIHLKKSNVLLSLILFLSHSFVTM